MATSAWDGDVAQALRQHLGEAVLATSSYVGQNFADLAPASLPAALGLLHSLGFDYLVDITAVHYPKREQPFDIHYILYSFERNERLRLRLALGGNASVDSATAVYPGANWMEREIFDMFGIVFTGHPDLTRILLPEEWQGHPLRKDYAITQMDNAWVQQNLGIAKGQ